MGPRIPYQLHLVSTCCVKTLAMSNSNYVCLVDMTLGSVLGIYLCLDDVFSIAELIFSFHFVVNVLNLGTPCCRIYIQLLSMFALSLQFCGLNRTFPGGHHWHDCPVALSGFHLQMTNLQMSCKDFTTWQGTRIVIPAMAARQHVLLKCKTFTHLWCL